MAVLLEALSVIVKKSAIAARYRGGWEAFVRDVPNPTLCADDDLARVVFMAPQDVATFVSRLENRGLVFRHNHEVEDLTVVDQRDGPTVPTQWLEFGDFKTTEGTVKACWVAGEKDSRLAVPANWDFAGRSQFIPRNCLDDRVKFLRHEGAVDVCLDLRSGKEICLERLVADGGSEASAMNRLRAIAGEALELEAQLDPLAALTDVNAIAPIFKRLGQQLSPEILGIRDGDRNSLALMHFVIGILYRIIREPKHAEAALRRANEVQPGVVPTLRELVRCIGEQNRPQEALVFAREAVRIDPLDAASWSNLAMCHLQCRNREEAQLALREALRLDPQDPINRCIRDHFENYFK